MNCHFCGRSKEECPLGVRWFRGGEWHYACIPCEVSQHYDPDEPQGGRLRCDDLVCCPVIKAPKLMKKAAQKETDFPKLSLEQLASRLL